MDSDTGSIPEERRHGRRRADLDIAVVTSSVEDRLEALSTDVATVQAAVETSQGQIAALGHRVEALNLNGSASALKDLGKVAPELIQIVTQHKAELEIEHARAVVRAARHKEILARLAWARGPYKILAYITPFFLGAIGIEAVHYLAPFIAGIHLR